MYRYIPSVFRAEIQVPVRKLTRSSLYSQSRPNLHFPFLKIPTNLHIVPYWKMWPGAPPAWRLSTRSLKQPYVLLMLPCPLFDSCRYYCTCEGPRQHRYYRDSNTFLRNSLMLLHQEPKSTSYTMQMWCVPVLRTSTAGLVSFCSVNKTGVATSSTSTVSSCMWPVLVESTVGPLVRALLHLVIYPAAVHYHSYAMQAWQSTTLIHFTATFQRSMLDFGLWVGQRLCTHQSLHLY